jgi:hypothetical protein
MDELPVVEEKTRDENKEARQPRSLLDLLEHFPGKTLCCTKVRPRVQLRAAPRCGTCWCRGASDLLEEEKKKNEPE